MSKDFVCPRCLERFAYSAWQNSAGQRVAAPPRPSAWRRFTDPFRVPGGDPDGAARFEVTPPQPLRVDKRQLPLTPLLLEEGQSPEPLTVVFRRSSRGAPERSMNVVFFDASGEQLSRKGDLGRFGKFLYVASGIVVVLSPGMFPGLQSAADPGESSDRK